MRYAIAMKTILSLVGILTLLSSSGAHAFETNVPKTFDELCRRDSSGFPADPDVVNCWGFESDEELVYHDPSGPSSPCRDASGRHILADHPNGTLNPEPIQNAYINTETCLYPDRVSTFAASGTHSLKIVQIDEGGGNSGGTFHPWFKHYIGADGRRKFAGFGAGGELWIHWRYRQNEGLFQYDSKRFMVTHRYSSYEHVLGAYGSINGATHSPPHNYVCAYNYKGSGSYGCSDTSFYEPDKWHTFVMHVKIPDPGDLNSGLFELFMDGQRILHRPNFHNPEAFTPADVGAYNDALDYETERDHNILLRLDFLLFENGKTGVGTRPEGVMYVDDIIVSRKELPTVLTSGGSETPVPNPPQSLSAN